MGAYIEPYTAIRTMQNRSLLRSITSHTSLYNKFSPRNQLHSVSHHSPQSIRVYVQHIHNSCPEKKNRSHLKALIGPNSNSMSSMRTNKSSISKSRFHCPPNVSKPSRGHQNPLARSSLVFVEGLKLNRMTLPKLPSRSFDMLVQWMDIGEQ
jgi:hypothetical protein